jgi:hypothetical protein
MASKPMEATFAQRRLSTADRPSPPDLRQALWQLDRRLERALTASQDWRRPGGDAFQGLSISYEEACHLLAREACATPPTGHADEPDEPLFNSTDAYPAQLARLATKYRLTPFDLDVIVIAVAPELDLRYERLYAYLQDDVTRKRPSVDLALSLLCSSPDARLARRAHFSADAPLVREGLLQLLADPHQLQPPLLARHLKPDPQVVHLLVGHGGLDARLAAFCRMVEPSATLAGAPVAGDVRRALRASVVKARKTERRLKLYFRGRRGAGRRLVAEALAGETGSRLLLVDLARAPEGAADFEQALKLALREAEFQDALPYLEGFDAVCDGERRALGEPLAAPLEGAAGVLFLAGERAPAPAVLGQLEVLEIPFPEPDFAERRDCWRENLRRRRIKLEARELDHLAGRFRLTRGEIAAAAGVAAARARWHAAARGRSSRLTLAELCAAARVQADGNLKNLAHKIEPKYTWGDIVLPPDQLSLLEEVCEQARHQHLVYGEWGFDRKLSLGRGLNVLFTGPPGTGKTMAAEVIANDLYLDLYKIDLSQVVSKYIGETEKNLRQIFEEAQGCGAILFFDEADALFGKRSEVKDAHDRYANIEVGYLLQRMEEYDGIAILATNLRQNMDEAFVRRMHAVVEFPFPDEEYRRRIWESLFPPEAPLGGDVDFAALAREIKLAGGNLKNIGLAAAFYAAADGGLIRTQHLAHAARREFQKLGRTWDVRAWGDAAGASQA